MLNSVVLDPESAECSAMVAQQRQQMLWCWIVVIDELSYFFEAPGGTLQPLSPMSCVG